MWRKRQLVFERDESKRPTVEKERQERRFFESLPSLLSAFAKKLDENVCIIHMLLPRVLGGIQKLTKAAGCAGAPEFPVFT